MFVLLMVLALVAFLIGAFTAAKVLFVVGVILLVAGFVFGASGDYWNRR